MPHGMLGHIPHEAMDQVGWQLGGCEARTASAENHWNHETHGMLDKLSRLHCDPRWKSGLIRDIIPKWPQFRLVNYYHLPRMECGKSEKSGEDQDKG